MSEVSSFEDMQRLADKYGLRILTAMALPIDWKRTMEFVDLTRNERPELELDGLGFAKPVGLGLFEVTTRGFWFWKKTVVDNRFRPVIFVHGKTVEIRDSAYSELAEEIKALLRD